MPEANKAAPRRDGFGIFYSDHMFIMEWSEHEGWHKARIEPYRPLTLDPAAMVLHYAQAAFEGFKAYPSKDGRILLFRPELNLARMNESMKRICVPTIDAEFVLAAIKKLIAIDRTGSRRAKDSPSISAHGDCHRAPHRRTSVQALSFYVITSPVAAYYKEGFSPVKSWSRKTTSGPPSGPWGAKAAETTRRACWPPRRPTEGVDPGVMAGRGRAQIRRRSRDDEYLLHDQRRPRYPGINGESPSRHHP